MPDYGIDISVRDTTGTNISGTDSVIAGRNLSVDDIGKPVLLMRADVQKLQLPVGTRC